MWWKCSCSANLLCATTLDEISSRRLMKLWQKWRDSHDKTWFLRNYHGLTSATTEFTFRSRYDAVLLLKTAWCFKLARIFLDSLKRRLRRPRKSPSVEKCYPGQTRLTTAGCFEFARIFLDLLKRRNSDYDNLHRSKMSHRPNTTE